VVKECTERIEITAMVERFPIAYFRCREVEIKGDEMSVALEYCKGEKRHINEFKLVGISRI